MRKGNKPRGGIAAITLASLLVWSTSCVSGNQPGMGQNVTSVPQLGDATPSIASTGIPVPTFVLDPGKGALIGRVDLHQTSWERVEVFLAPFYPAGEEGEGFYVLEPSVHPHVSLQPGGLFQLANIDPGSYVMVIGSDPMEALAVEADGEPRVWQVIANEVLDVGQISYLQDQGAFVE